MERQRWNEEILVENKNLPAHERKDLKIRKGELYIGDKKHQSEVRFTSGLEALKLDAPLQHAAKQVYKKIARGITIEVEGSKFQGFTIDVDNLQQVMDGYTAMRLHHLNQRHIVCAYRLPGLDLDNCGGWDDGEHGAARMLLNAMKIAGITHRCLFVTRWYEGIHIGVARFESYLKAARSVIIHTPMNRLLNKAQTPWSEEYCTFQMVDKTQRKRGRGYWQGRGMSGRGRKYGRGTGRGRGGSRQWSDIVNEEGARDSDGEYDFDGFPVSAVD